MRINYKGMDKEYNYRIAEICYDEENEKETKMIKKMAKVFEIRGWKVDWVTDGYILVEVDDYEQYKAFVEEYKDLKHKASMWVKYGM